MLHTELQNLRKAEVGRNLLEASWPYSPFLRTMLIQLLNISRDGHFPPSLDSLLQCSVSLPTKRCFIVLRQYLLSFSLCLFPLITETGVGLKNRGEVSDQRTHT